MEVAAILVLTAAIGLFGWSQHVQMRTAQMQFAAMIALQAEHMERRWAQMSSEWKEIKTARAQVLRFEQAKAEADAQASSKTAWVPLIASFLGGNGKLNFSDPALQQILGNLLPGGADGQMGIEEAVKVLKEEAA